MLPSKNCPPRQQTKPIGIFQSIITQKIMSKMSSCRVSMNLLTDLSTCLMHSVHPYTVYQPLLLLNNGWSSQKCCPATLLWSAKLWRWINHHNPLANMPSLTGIGMGMDQIKYAYQVYQILLLNNGWSSQKCCPATVLLSAKVWR